MSLGLRFGPPLHKPTNKALHLELKRLARAAVDDLAWENDMDQWHLEREMETDEDYADDEAVVEESTLPTYNNVPKNHHFYFILGSRSSHHHHPSTPSLCQGMASKVQLPIMPLHPQQQQQVDLARRNADLVRLLEGSRGLRVVVGVFHSNRQPRILLITDNTEEGIRRHQDYVHALNRAAIEGRLLPGFDFFVVNELQPVNMPLDISTLMGGGVP